MGKAGKRKEMVGDRCVQEIHVEVRCVKEFRVKVGYVKVVCVIESCMKVLWVKEWCGTGVCVRELCVKGLVRESSVFFQVWCKNVLCAKVSYLPSGYVKIAIENGHL